MSHHHATTSSSVLHITITRVISLVTEELLHQVLDVYGMNEVCVLQKPTHVEAFVEFQSWLEASQARGALHGQCIGDDCCLLDIEHAPPSVSVHRLPNGAPVFFDWECEEMEPLTSSHHTSASTAAPLSAPPSAPTKIAATPMEPTLAQIAERLNFHMARLQATLEELRNSRARAESTAVGDEEVLTQVVGSSLFLELDIDEDTQVLTCVGGVSIFLELDVEPHDDVFTTVGGLSIYVEEAGMNSDTDVLTYIGGWSLFIEWDIDSVGTMFVDDVCTSVGGLSLFLELVVDSTEGIFKASHLQDVVCNEEITDHVFTHDGLYYFLDLLDYSDDKLGEKSPRTWHAFSTWNWDPGIPREIIDTRSVGNLHLFDQYATRSAFCQPVILFKAVTYGVCLTLPWDPGEHIYVDSAQSHTFTHELLYAVGRTERDIWFMSNEISVHRYVVDGRTTRPWDRVTPETPYIGKDIAGYCQEELQLIYMPRSYAIGRVTPMEYATSPSRSCESYKNLGNVVFSPGDVWLHIDHGVHCLVQSVVLQADLLDAEQPRGSGTGLLPHDLKEYLIALVYMSVQQPVELIIKSNLYSDSHLAHGRSELQLIGSILQLNTLLYSQPWNSRCKQYFSGISRNYELRLSQCKLKHYGELDFWTSVFVANTLQHKTWDPGVHQNVTAIRGGARKIIERGQMGHLGQI